MQEMGNNKYTDDFNGKIDLRELFFILIKGKWIITYATIIVLLIGFTYSLFLPDLYESEALLAPVDESTSLSSVALSQYSGLAGLAGINLPTQEVGGNHKKAIELIGSLNFFEKNILPNIFLPDLMAVKSWDNKENKIIYDDSIYQNISNTWVRDFSYPQKLIPSAQESFEIFKDHNLNISENKKSGYVSLSIKHQSPQVAKQWVRVIFEEVNSFYRQKDKAQSERAVAFLNKQMISNNLSEIKKVTATLLEKEIQKLTLVEANEDYVFEYVYPPSVMEEKSEPDRFIIFILSFLLGVLTGVIIVLLRQFISEGKIKNN